MSALEHKFALSEPWRVYKQSKRHITLEAYCSDANKSRSWEYIKRRIKRKSVFECIEKYQLDAVYKETVRFHIADDPVNGDILSAVLSNKFSLLGCIRHPESVVLSVFYRFRPTDHSFDMDDTQVRGLVKNLETFAAFCRSFSIPIVRYEDWSSNPQILHPYSSGRCSTNIDLSDVRFFGIGDARAQKSSAVNQLVKENSLPEETKRLIHKTSGEHLKLLYPEIGEGK